MNQMMLFLSSTWLIYHLFQLNQGEQELELQSNLLLIFKLEYRILIPKPMTDNELLTLVAFYDINENKENHLNGVEKLLKK